MRTKERFGRSRSISTTAGVAIIVVIIIVAAAAGFFILSSGPTTTSSSTTSRVPTSSTTSQLSTSSTTSASQTSARSTTTTTSQELQSVTVATLPFSDSIAARIGVKKGYFLEHGLNVTLVTFATPVLVNTAVEQGSAQIGLQSPAFTMTAREQGFDLKFITPIDMANYSKPSDIGVYIPGVSPHGVAVLASSGIKSWKDLAGKTIGVTGLGSATQANVQFMLKHFGVDLSTVNWQVLPAPTMVSTLQQKRVDAVTLLEPFITQLLIANETAPTTGQFKIVGDDYHYGNNLITGYMAKAEWVSAHPDIVSKFIAAHTESTKAIIANSTLIREATVTELKMAPAVAARLILLTYWYQPVPYSALQNQIDIYLQFGILKNPKDNASQLIDTRYFQIAP